MKILSITNTYTNTQNKQTANFKRISPQIKKQVITAASNSTTRDMFVKMAGVLGLTSIITWVNALKNNDTKEKESLDKINTYWIEQENEQYVNPEKSENYLDLVSRADLTEIDLWTQSILNPIEVNNENTDTTLLTDTVKKAFLDLNLNEATMSISANKRLMTMLSQIRAYTQVPEEIKNGVVNKLEQKLGSLVKQAQELQNSEETSDIFEKISNIIRVFSRINLLGTKENPTTQESQEDSTIVATQNVEEPAEDVAPEENLKIIGKIELQNDGISRFKPEERKEDNTKVDTPILKEFKITEENKDFIETFKKYFKKSKHIQPEIYAEKIDFIQKLYESYEKDIVKKAFLKRLTEENFLQILEKYYNYTYGKGADIDFIAFSHMEKLKHRYSGEMSKEDFDKLLCYKNKEVKYFTVQDLQENIILTFSPGTTVQERIKISFEFYNNLFNIQESSLFLNNAEMSYDKENIKQELIEKLSKNADEYPNITEYLGLDTSDVADELKRGNTEGAYDTAEYILSSKEISRNLSNLTNLIQNKAFDDLFEGVHSRMRFIERFVLDDSRNICKSDYEIKQITSRKITRFLKTLETAKEFNVGNYIASDPKRKGHKCAPKLIVKDYEFGLNKNLKIRTIFPSDNYNN